MSLDLDNSLFDEYSFEDSEKIDEEIDISDLGGKTLLFFSFVFY